MDLEKELTLNKAKVTTIVDGYVQQFRNEYAPENRNLDALSDFCTKHNLTYRSKVAELTTMTFHNLISEGQASKENIQKTYDDNGWNIGMLFVAIAKECGLPVETKW